MTTAKLAQLDPSPDPIIERYKPDVDRTLIRENLRKSHEERLLTLQQMQGFVDELVQLVRRLGVRDDRVFGVFSKASIGGCRVRDHRRDRRDAAWLRPV